MRLLVPILALAMVGAGCRCSPTTPKAVTVRVKNTTKASIYVDDTTGTLGVQMRREVNGDWFGFDEHPCACQTCEHVCEPFCACDAGVDGAIRRIASGATVERTWDGVVQVSDTGACGGAPSCVSPENAPLNEVFRAHLCWASSISHFEADDAGVGPGLLPTAGLQCTDQEFRPQDGVVEVGPPKGADCTTTADCKGQDELCFDGSCTAGCPGNDYPEVGTSWSLMVTKGSDTGFFTSQPRGEATQYTGTGTLSSAGFSGQTLQLAFSRTGSVGETLSASVSVLFPQGTGAPLTAGTKVSVLFVDATTSDNPTNRALTVREASTGALLLAADVAQLGRVLIDAELSPFSLSFADVPVSCRIDACGRFLFYVDRFSTPSGPVELEPGKLSSLNTPAGTYTFFSVTNGAFAGHSKCTITDIRPYAIWRNAGP